MGVGIWGVVNAGCGQIGSMVGLEGWGGGVSDLVFHTGASSPPIVISCLFPSPNTEGSIPGSLTLMALDPFLKSCF